VAPIFERQKAEWDDDEQDGLLMHVPAKEKRSITTKRHGTDESLPGRLEEELYKTDLKNVRIKMFPAYWRY